MFSKKENNKFYNTSSFCYDDSNNATLSDLTIQYIIIIKAIYWKNIVIAKKKNISCY